MKQNETAPLVCITGAAGYLGSHVVKRCLEEGLRVRAAVRDPGDADQVGHLDTLVPDAAHPLELVAADLMDPDGHEQAIRGCQLVCHMASPVKLFAPDPQREIVDPAVRGTEHVLATAARTESVQRVVMTSSIAAITGDDRDPDHLFTEADWNTSASLEHGPYLLSKTLAERAAWRIHAEAASARRFDLITINPAVVFGPLLARRHGKTSPINVLNLLKRKMPASPRLSFGIVDVREVAEAHLRALLGKDVAGRHILQAGSLWMQDMARILAAAFPAFPVPTRRLPDLAVYAAALFDKRLDFRFLRRNLGRQIHVDNRKSVASLGLAYRPLAETLLDTAQSFVHLGLAKAPRH